MADRVQGIVKNLRQQHSSSKKSIICCLLPETNQEREQFNAEMLKFAQHECISVLNDMTDDMFQPDGLHIADSGLAYFVKHLESHSEHVD